MAEVVQLFRLREHIEEGVRALFAASELVAITRKTKPEKFLQARPRYEIKATIGPVTGHRHVCPDSIARFDSFRFVLAIQTVTNPAETQGSNGAHEEFVAKCRELICTAAQQSWTDTVNFPLVFIAEPLRESGSESVLKAEDGVEYTTLPFSGVVTIRQTAWPTS